MPGLCLNPACVPACPPSPAPAGFWNAPPCKPGCNEASSIREKTDGSHPSALPAAPHPVCIPASTPAPPGRDGGLPPHTPAAFKSPFQRGVGCSITGGCEERVGNCCQPTLTLPGTHQPPGLPQPLFPRLPPPLAKLPAAAVPIPSVFQSTGAAGEGSQRGTASRAGRCRQLVIYLKLHLCRERLSCQEGSGCWGEPPAAPAGAFLPPLGLGKVSSPWGEDAAPFTAPSPRGQHLPLGGMGGTCLPTPLLSPPLSEQASASPPQWLGPLVVTGMCDSGAVSKVTPDELGLCIPLCPPHPSMPPHMEEPPGAFLL